MQPTSLTDSLLTRHEVTANRAVLQTKSSNADGNNLIPLRRLSSAERAGKHAVPVMDLRFAAGAFSDFQVVEAEASTWVELPAWVNPRPGLFVAQVIGESM